MIVRNILLSTTFDQTQAQCSWLINRYNYKILVQNYFDLGQDLQQIQPDKS